MQNSSNLRFIGIITSTHNFILLDSKTLVSIYEHQFEFELDVYISADVLLFKKINEDWKVLISLNDSAKIDYLDGTYIVRP